MRYLSNGDVSLALETRGNGPRQLLFVHGWISSRRMFYDVVERLDPARFTAHLLDLRGAGLSDRPADGHDTLGYASDVRAALAAIDGDVEIVAHSMGGKIAQYVALAPPQNLRRLLLVAPGTARAVPLNPTHRRLAEEAFGHRTRLERFVAAAMHAAVSAATLERLVEDALLAQREAWFGWYDRGRTFDFSARLGEIALPAIVVAGEHDVLAPPARVRRDVAGALAEATFITLKGAGHNIPVEMPDAVARLIERG